MPNAPSLLDVARVAAGAVGALVLVGLAAGYWERGRSYRALRRRHEAQAYALHLDRLLALAVGGDAYLAVDAAEARALAEQASGVTRDAYAISEIRPGLWRFSRAARRPRGVDLPTRA